jgi:hypothetical protein
MKRVAVLAVLAMLACTTTQQSSAPSAAAPKSNYKNLQVLPKDISREQLLATMRSFTRGLGVRCNHCHVVKATEPKEELDFPSDAKDEKKNARTMILMTREINRTWIPRVTKEPADMRVGCWTCHRGKPEPESPPPPPEPQAQPKPSR